MIIVQLIGGLGNQLFQYAAARRLAFQRQVPLKLDKTGFETYTLHAYSLNHFNIIEDFATPEEINHYRRFDLPHRVLRKLLPFRLHKWAKERTFYFNPSVLDLSGDVYLEGHWQTECYFKDAEPVVRRELSFKTPPTAENQALIDQIGADNGAVSIHVRRGDYVSNVVTQEVHGLSPLTYYAAAIQHIAQASVQPHFYVFSDDPAWVRANLQIEYPTTYVEHNKADRNYEDLRLMSLCRHHIIANSTFSWWGAWLGSNPMKIVIAPKRWFNTSEKDTRDLIPAEWIQL